MRKPNVDPALLDRIAKVGRILRPTPTIPLDLPGVRLHAKLEYHNPVGSLKDRSAYWILKCAAERGEIRTGSTIIESSSGNFASALATFCRMFELKFIPVIDPNIAGIYESFLRRTCDTVVKVEERDDTGGFLKTRLKRVQTMCAETEGSYWTNQYGNPDGMAAHYKLTGKELCDAFERLDYVFIGVSTAGTIAGVSKRVRERFPQAKIVAVDAVGSVIFGGQPKKRYIPGIGASIAPELLRHAHYDEVVMVHEYETVEGCYELLERHGLFVGGSSGTLYAAVKKTLPKLSNEKDPPVAAFICADRGTAYLDTVYNAEWGKKLRE